MIAVLTYLWVISAPSAVAINAAATPSWGQFLVGLLTGSSALGIAGLIANRKKTGAETTATLVGASGEVVKFSGELLVRYVAEVQQLTERVARLEGLLDQRDRENRWLTQYNAQLIEYITEVCNMPVPHPVPERPPHMD